MSASRNLAQPPLQARVGKLWSDFCQNLDFCNSKKGQVNEEFWLNMNQDNRAEPMGQSEFDKFLAKSEK